MSKRKPIERKPEYYEEFIDRAWNTVEEFQSDFDELLLVLTTDGGVLARVYLMDAIPDGAFRDIVAYRGGFYEISLFFAKSNYENGDVGVVQVMPNGEILTSAWRGTQEGWIQLEDGPATDGAVLIGRTISRLSAMGGFAQQRLTHSAPMEVQ
jgi:hypothetical protein